MPYTIAFKRMMRYVFTAPCGMYSDWDDENDCEEDANGAGVGWYEFDT
jgi:hypothetical protein